MGALLGLSRGIDRVNTFIGRNVSWLILIAVLVSAANAIIRKVFNTSSNSWLELQWYLFGAAFMGAAAYTLQQNEHIRIDIFYGTRTRRTQHWIDLFGHVFFTLPFVILMTWQLIPYALGAYRIGQKNNVLVHRFITKNTFEEKINEIIQKKRSLADMTVSVGESWIGNMTDDELSKIFR